MTVNNVHKAYRDILMNGFRYKPSSLHDVNITRPSVDGTRLAGRVASLDPQKGILPIEMILCKAKLNDPSFKESVRPGTIIYTTYVDGIISPVLKAVNALGYSAEAYTGNNDDRDGAFVRFVEGKTDVLIASKPVILGVDGLQNRCNRIVILSLPWTWADYEQLIGRINRPRGAGNALNGSSIEVIIPQVNINTETGASWSWDRRRLALITNKRTLGEAVVDGTIDKIYTIDKKALLSQAIENLTSITNAEK